MSSCTKTSDPLSYVSGYIHTSSIAHRSRVNRNGAGYENMYICNALIFYHYLQHGAIQVIFPAVLPQTLPFSYKSIIKMYFLSNLNQFSVLSCLHKILDRLQNYATDIKEASQYNLKARQHYIQKNKQTKKTQDITHNDPN